MSEEVKVYEGQIVFFSAQKGFGFIDQDHAEEDIFVHYSNLQIDGYKTVRPTQRVSYELGENAHGVQAVNVQLIGPIPEEE